MHGSEELAIALYDENKRFPSIGVMSEQIDRELNIDAMLAIFNDGQHVMNGFTHGGMHQIRRRFNGGAVEVNFKENEIDDLLRASTIVLALSLLAFAYDRNNKQIADVANGIIKKLF